MSLDKFSKTLNYIEFSSSKLGSLKVKKIFEINFFDNYVIGAIEGVGSRRAGVLKKHNYCRKTARYIDTMTKNRDLGTYQAYVVFVHKTYFFIDYYFVLST